MTRLLLVSACLASAAATAQPAPDPTFADAGFAHVKLPPSAGAWAVAEAPDGALTLAVTTAYDASTPYTTFLARLRPDGTPDEAFGPEGVRRIVPPAGLLSVQVSDLALLPDGRLAAVGNTTGPSGMPVPLIALFTADGQPDSTFAGDGFAQLESFAGAVASAFSVAVVDGGLVVAGESQTPQYGFVSRLRLDGTPDPAFGSGGTTRIADDDSNVLFDLAAFSDGRLVAVGMSFRRPALHWDALFVRLTAAGQVETTNGVTKRDIFGSSHDYALRATVLPGGRTLVAGTTKKRAGDAMTDGTTLFLLGPDGAPETGFGFEGWTWTDVHFATVGQAQSGSEWPGQPFFTAAGVGVPVGGINGAGVDGFAVLLQRANGAPGAPETVRLFADRPNVSMFASTPLADGRFVSVGLQTDPVSGVQTPVAAQVAMVGPTATDAAPAGPITLRIAPNPVAGSARVSFSLDVPADVSVRVVDVLGRTVAALAEGPLGAGEHAFALEASALPSGVYAVVAMVGGERSVTQVTVVR